jgi:hypothetical protein
MLLTIKQAGEAIGKSKATVLRAIQSGKISATKDEATGSWMIDPAELHRVFPPASNGAVEAVHGDAKPDNINVHVLRIELAMMQQRMDDLRQERERERADKDAMIADLREDRDRWRTQAEKLLLTDQRAKAPDVMVTPPPTSEAIITPPPPAADPAPAATSTSVPAAPARSNAAPVAVKVRPVKKPPAKEAGWFRRMMGGR